MLVVLFRSRLTEAAGADYDAMNDELEETARNAPGFVAMKSYAADDGERLTIVRWNDAETLKQWREYARHREAQRIGRERWYQWYQIEVAELVRDSQFSRKAGSMGDGEAAGGRHAG
jgi:heme-degrading monooxygenase HmoA